MFSTDNILSLVFGMLGALLAVGGIWATIWVYHKYNSTPNMKVKFEEINKMLTFEVTGPDLELGLLPQNPSARRTPELDPESYGHLHRGHIGTENKNLISDTLEVFSRHLRART